MTKKALVWMWMGNNYQHQFPTIRAVWYAMKPVMQKHNITDKTATELIGKWLWEKFSAGSRNIYGMIGNSTRVSKNRLPIILFCEKNTLDPFDEIEDYIYANAYRSSGQSNSYELANLINSMDTNEEIYVYAVADFDKAGDQIVETLTSKLRPFFPYVHTRRLEIDDIHKYETYTQPDGSEGLEIDAVGDLVDLVLEDLEDFLPYELFEEVAIEETKQGEYNTALSVDVEHIRLTKQLKAREIEIWRVVSDYEYNYILQSDLWHLDDRVEVNI